MFGHKQADRRHTMRGANPCPCHQQRQASVEAREVKYYGNSILADYNTQRGRKSTIKRSSNDERFSHARR